MARSSRPDDNPRQLALELPVEPGHLPEDFVVGPSNERAHELIEAWPDWPSEAVLLIGPKGCGKTHLGSIWAGRAHAWRVRRAEIALGDTPRLMTPAALLVEDAHEPGDEAALFHLVNAARLRRSHLLITADRPPALWGLATADLLSRLRLAPSAVIAEPDDALLRLVLVKLFVDRQLVVDAGVVEEILLRGGRSFADARTTVEALDTHALAARRRVTRALVREVLASKPPPSEDEPAPSRPE